MPKTNRLPHIDALRGLAMLMVVYSHLLTFSMGGITPSLVGQFMNELMLPLFFFISGFCMFKSNFVLTLKGWGRQVVAKTQAILIPTVVMFALFMLYSQNDMLFYLFRYDKSGYWFTWVLFQIVLTFLFFEVVASHFQQQVVKFLVRILPLFLFLIFSRVVGYESQAAVLFEWVKVKEFYLYFLIGYYTHCWSPYILHFLNRDWANASLLILSVLSYLIIGGGKSLIFCLILLYFLSSRLNERYTLTAYTPFRVLNNIGKNTLQIYFLHFYLLFVIPILPEWLVSMQHDKCFGTHSCSSLVELVCCGSLSLFISYVCIWIAEGVKLIPLIYRLCFGPFKK